MGSTARWAWRKLLSAAESGWAGRVVPLAPTRATMRDQRSGERTTRAQARATGVAEGGGHGFIGGNHEAGDEVGGAVLGDGLNGLHLAVDDDGVGFDSVEVEGAEGDALLVEKLGGFVL